MIRKHHFNFMKGIIAGFLVLLLAGSVCTSALTVSAATQPAERDNSKGTVHASEAARPSTADAAKDEERESTPVTKKTSEDGWVQFFLMCNEGMSNRGGNAGNTMMAISMDENTGGIKLMMFAWDTFVKYEGYDRPQKIDMAYRNRGPEEAMKVFNDNFHLDIDKYLSLNFLNLASLVDDYGGVTVAVSRAERNALNGMVSSKKENLQAMLGKNLLGQEAIELLADEYYLNDFGPETQLNGMQAVAYGWLQYDSVYNCCLREANIIAGLFKSVGNTLRGQVVFYTNDTKKPTVTDGRRVVNLDNLSEDDLVFIEREVHPIIDMSYNNLTEEEVDSITLALARISYVASRQGVNIMDHIQIAVFPLEAKDPYDTVAGVKGHLVDYEANTQAMTEFLYKDIDMSEE